MEHLFIYTYDSVFLCVCEVLVAQSCLTLCDPMTVAHQAPLSMGFSRQEYWSWLSFPSPGDLSDPGVEPRSPALQADSLLPDHQGSLFFFFFKVKYLVKSVPTFFLWVIFL